MRRKGEERRALGGRLTAAARVRNRIAVACRPAQAGSTENYRYASTKILLESIIAQRACWTRARRIQVVRRLEDETTRIRWSGGHQGWRGEYGSTKGTHGLCRAA